MTKPDDTAVGRFEMEVDCPDCAGSGVTKLRAWADLDGLDRMEVESIAELNIEDIRQLANYGEGGIDGECKPCAPAAAAAQNLAELGGSTPSMHEVPRRRPSSSLAALLSQSRQQRRG